jgi:hypothetical protein
MMKRFICSGSMVNLLSLDPVALTELTNEMFYGLITLVCADGAAGISGFGLVPVAAVFGLGATFWP